jgi:hypothetical protein
MEYIAFKSLLTYVDNEGMHLYSPVELTKWAYDSAGHPCLMADSMDGRHGIYACTWQEAAGYRGRIYMVVPYLLSGGDPVIAIGTSGWRSSAATVIAGPWDKHNQGGMRQAAETILASHAQGYRQIDGILIWAISIIGLPNMHVEDFLPLLEWGISEADENLRLLAVRAAAKIGERALSVLERAIADENPNVRREAQEAAVLLGYNPPRN